MPLDQSSHDILARAVAATARGPHKSRVQAEAEQVFQQLGPKPVEPPQLFQCGAPWTAHATDEELTTLARNEARINRRQDAIRELKAKRTRIMMRCIRRMRRAQGLEPRR